MIPGYRPDFAPPDQREPPPWNGHLSELSVRLYPAEPTGETWQANWINIGSYALVAQPS
jgi:hypothetical protein